jgi:hypothetical protein
MKVKVGDTIHNAEDEPIMVILTDQDKKNITNMAPEATRYCCFPSDFSTEEIEEWMK